MLLTRLYPLYINAHLPVLHAPFLHSFTYSGDM